MNLNERIAVLLSLQQLECGPTSMCVIPRHLESPAHWGCVQRTSWLSDTVVVPHPMYTTLQWGRRIGRIEHTTGPGTKCSADLGWAVKTPLFTELRSPSLSGAKCPLWLRRCASSVRRPWGVAIMLEWEINLILSSHTDKNPEPLKTLNTPSYHCLTLPRASSETLSLSIAQIAYIHRRCPRPCRNRIVFISEFYI